ncbi:hypothetical protein M404DRAFT_135795 [Pisolithus tinctorius Marx 270]|uniref:Uncharacterized protein n=1 Tax=Pisolithus tinctorius Marx 270 TaxID=870435 RepID=A0A0C3JET2_PISTI|nr:hypothetical protein M404DRAFT_135795 [Pisolithus tinctorius Marx 270]
MYIFLADFVLQDIVCAANVQHNCVDSQCTVSGTKKIQQECLHTTWTAPTVKHKSMCEYLLNVYSIHNYKYIQELVPENLHCTPLHVSNVLEAQKSAVSQMNASKAAKSALTKGHSTV